MIIRDMVMDDLDQVMILENKCFQVPWTEEAFKSELTQNQLAHYLVAQLDQVCGYCGIWYIMDEGHITNVAVDPAYRKQGIGQQLVEAMIQQGKSQGIQHLTLEVRKSNTPAINLYSKMGFETAGVRPKYYTDNQEDALIMWYKVNDHNQ